MRLLGYCFNMFAQFIFQFVQTSKSLLCYIIEFFIFLIYFFEKVFYIWGNIFGHAIEKGNPSIKFPLVF